MYVQLVGCERQDRAEPLLLLEKRRTDIDQTALKDRTHFGFRFVYFLSGISVYGEIEPDIEDTFHGPDRELRGKGKILALGDQVGANEFAGPA